MIVSANAPSGGVEFYKPGTTDSATSLVAKEEATGANSISISFTEAPKAGDYIKIDNLMINFGSPEVPFDPLTNTVTIDVANKSGADVLQEIDNLLKDISNIPAQKSSAIPALSSHNIVGNNLILNTTKSDDGKVFGDATSNGLEVEIHDADFVSTSGADLKLDMQVGANANESMEISLSVMDAAALRLAFAADRKTPITTPGADAIAGIDVSSSQDAAKAAIAVIDNAVKMVSEERSKMGAYQNRMEHTITNLSTANENLTAAESRIRDADMAMEMTNFTKNNIINQAATAMLAQANQLPQGILQLLK
jgi:flagellin